MRAMRYVQSKSVEWVTMEISVRLNDELYKFFWVANFFANMPIQYPHTDTKYNNNFENVAWERELE